MILSPGERPACRSTAGAARIARRHAACVPRVRRRVCWLRAGGIAVERLIEQLCALTGIARASAEDIFNESAVDGKVSFDAFQYPKGDGGGGRRRVAIDSISKIGDRQKCLAQTGARPRRVAFLHPTSLAALKPSSPLSAAASARCGAAAATAPRRRTCRTRAGTLRARGCRPRVARRSRSRQTRPRIISGTFFTIVHPRQPKSRDGAKSGTKNT